MIPRPILSHLEWAKSNNYPISRSPWPSDGSFQYNHFIPSSKLLDYVKAMDWFHLNEEASIIQATNVKIMQLVWPNGSRRYELIGRDGSLLCDPFFSAWYAHLQGWFPYGNMNDVHSIELSINCFSSYFSFRDKTTHLIGDLNHGHWFMDYYAKAIHASLLNLPPVLIRSLDPVKYDSLKHANVSATVIPETAATSCIICLDELTVLSNPPPSIVPLTIRKKLITPIANDELVFLVKRKGNQRLLNLDAAFPTLSSIGVKFIDPTELNFSDLISLVTAAKILICPMGAEATNHIFRDKVSVVLLPESCKDPTLPSSKLLFSHLVIGNVFPIFCPDIVNHDDRSPNAAKFILDKRALNDLVNFLTSRK